VGDRVAERVVKVKLTATMDQYVAEMNKAAKATRDVGTEGAKLAQTRQAFDMVGRSAVVAGGLVAAGIGVAVSKFIEFDAAVSNVEAATRESAENMELLRDAALEAGATTVFSATESANAIEELGKAGLSTADILGGALDGSLSLAAAGGIGVAEAAGIAATALQQFELDGNQAVHVADLLAAGAGKAMGDVSDLSQALNQVGLVANSTGLSIEETTASLAAFASKGLLGSDAGTSFKAMLQRLTPQSNEAKEKMDELGISAFNAAGEFIGMEKFAGNLQNSLSDLTDEQRNSALATIFGSDAVRAANVLYEEGAEGIRDWTTAVDDAGFAAETAATKLDNLKGDWEALTGAVDTALIGMGEAADGPLRLFTQSITGMVDGFNKLPEGGQQAVTWIGAAGAAAALAGGAYLLAVPKIAAYNLALEKMGAGAQRTSRVLGGFAKGAGLLAGLGLAANVLDRLATGADKAAPGLDRVLQMLTTNNLDGAFKNASAGANSFAEALELVEGSSFDANMERIGETLGGVAGGITGQVTEAREGFIALDGALSQLVSSGGGDKAAELFDQLKDKAEAQGIPIEKLTALFPQYDNALAGAVAGTEDSAAAYETAAAEAEALNGQLEDLISSLNELNGINQDAISTNAAYQSALAGISDEVARQRDEYEKVNGTLDGFAPTLDEATEAGSANAAMLAQVAGAAQDAAESQFELDRQTMSAKDATDKYAATLADQRQAFEDSAEAAGFNADEVQILADKVFALPDEKEIEIIAATENAARRIDQFVRTYNGKVITLQLTTDQVQVGDRVYGGLRDGRATGGAIYGPGTGTSDSVPVNLSTGEHVWTAAEVQAAGGHGAVEDMRKWVLGGYRGMATGGPVGTSGGGGGSPINVTQNIYPAPGMSEQQIARIAEERLAFAARGNG
jgi:TP901 family phage tail tape measure protein